jgi:hypothetical protein
MNTNTRGTAGADSLAQGQRKHLSQSKRSTQRGVYLLHYGGGKGTGITVNLDLGRLTSAGVGAIRLSPKPCGGGVAVITLQRYCVLWRP